MRKSLRASDLKNETFFKLFFAGNGKHAKVLSLRVMNKLLKH